MNIEAIFLILLITALLVALVIALAASDFSNPCRVQNPNQVMQLKDAKRSEYPTNHNE